MKKEIIGAISQKEQLKEYWVDLCDQEKIIDNRYQRNVMYKHAFLVACREAVSYTHLTLPTKRIV